MSGLWNAPDVARRDERFPAAAHAASARSTASGVPATTICPGQLKFAGTSTSPSAHSSQSACTASSSAFSSALIAPGCAAAASAMSSERAFTSANVASSASMPDTASALIWPSEKPSTAAGSTPRAMSVRATATDSAASAGCANRVSFSFSASAPVTRSATSKPNTSDAHSKVSRTSGRSMRSAPMPGFCEPWPESMSTGFPAEIASIIALPRAPRCAPPGPRAPVPPAPRLRPPGRRWPRLPSRARARAPPTGPPSWCRCPRRPRRRA